MPRKKKETTIHESLQPLDTMQLLETAWPCCGRIQRVIDRLTESGSQTELRLLTNRLQRLAFRASPKGDFGNDAWVSG